jgi:ubiquinone/menaquinone biosynthesis C-methylase UbiE
VSLLDARFAGSIPAIYDQYLGPLIFEPYATVLAQKLSGLCRGRLLETAAGTGVVTRALARALPATVDIVATDLNQPMLDFAAAQSTQARPVTWRQANALELPFPDTSFDVVVCQFGVMFFPDKATAYREAYRVLKPGGQFIFSVWDRIEENEVPRTVTEGVASLFPADPPQFLARTPHGYFDKQKIRDEIEQAGFSRIELETVQRRSRAASYRDPAIGFCQGTPLRNEIEARDAGRLEEATDVAAEAVKARFGSGPIEGKIQAHIITAIK